MIYDFSVKKTDQSMQSLKKYKGKVLMIVNTATGCGLTPQYEGLEKLYQKYKKKGFEILDFPCNQFLNQAPGSDVELADFCKTNYQTTFETFAKVVVNGKGSDPLFAYLRKMKPEDEISAKKKRFCKKFFTKIFPNQGNISWNFTKFLISREGEVIYRFSPSTKPEQLEAFIEKLL